MIIIRQKNYSTIVGRSIASVNKFLLRQPKIKAYKKAINSEYKIGNKVLQGIDEFNTAYFTPGKIINNGIQKTIEHPITVGGVVAGKITDITHPATIAIPKSTIAMALGNKVLPKGIKEKLHKASLIYRDSKIAKKIDNLPPTPNILSALGSSMGL